MRSTYLTNLLPLMLPNDSLQEQCTSVPSASIRYSILNLPHANTTNDECRRRASAGNSSHGALLFTGYQTAGRGQGSHVWESEKDKNLLFTLYITPTFLPASKQFLLSEIASLATALALDSIHKGFCVKWNQPGKYAHRYRHQYQPKPF